jgi:hypothetical protein
MDEDRSKSILNIFLQVMYAAFDSGNYFVIPGSPSEVFQADNFIAKHYHQDARISLGLSPKDFVIAIVGTPFSYGQNLMEETLILQAVGPLIQQYHSENSTTSELKVKIFSRNITEKHRMILEVCLTSSCSVLSCDLVIYILHCLILCLTVY